ncbi:hypothetical protein KI387_002396, partial [Taxus chinensis]
MNFCMMILTIGLGVLLLAVFLLWKSSSGLNLPPGSFVWPLLGESVEYLASQRNNATRDFMEKRIKKYGGDIFKTHFLGAPMVVFYNPAGNHFLFSNENKLIQIPWPASLAKLFGNSLLTKVGDEAKDVRKTLLTFLKPEALQNFVGRTDFIIHDHLTRYWVGNEQIPVDLLETRYREARISSDQIRRIVQ